MDEIDLNADFLTFKTEIEEKWNSTKTNLFYWISLDGIQLLILNDIIRFYKLSL